MGNASRQKKVELGRSGPRSLELENPVPGLPLAHSPRGEGVEGAGLDRGSLESTGAQIWELGGPGTRVPLTWEQVHERVAAYWASHDRDGEPLPTPPVYSALCVRMLHRRCDRAIPRYATCTCWCYEEAE